MATAVLVCSELATDAVRYAHVPGANFEVRVTATGKECLVEVSDVSDVPPCPGTPGADDERGRGLLLVAALAESAGHRERPPAGKTVWARLYVIAAACAVLLGTAVAVRRPRSHVWPMRLLLEAENSWLAPDLPGSSAGHQAGPRRPARTQQHEDADIDLPRRVLSGLRALDTDENPSSGSGALRTREALHDG